LNWRENLLVREILEAKLPEPGGGCNVERSGMRRAIHWRADRRYTIELL